MKPIRRQAFFPSSLTVCLWIFIHLVGCVDGSGHRRPNIVIVVMDTVRQDHLSCYGYSRETTPTLKKLLHSSRIYDNAFSVSSWTAPSHASLFTGLYPIAHGTTQEYWRLDNPVKTLAEVLGVAGYQTAAFVENASLRKAMNFDQGFSDYFEIWKMEPDLEKRDTRTTLSQIRKRVDGLDRRKPFFFFVNLNGAHNPLNSSGKFRNTFVRDPSLTLDRYNHVDHYLEKKRYSEEELHHLMSLYDGEILNVDSKIREIIDCLKSENRWEETIFLVTSDHGDNLGDHKHMGHVFSLYGSTTRIPLIVHYPPLFVPGSRDTDPAQLTDIFPTLMNILDLDPGSSQGIDLLDSSSRKNRPVFCEFYKPVQGFLAFGEEKDNALLQKYNRRLKSITRNDVKLIWGSDEKHELYDLTQDPGENKNVIHDPAYEKIKGELLSDLQQVKRKYHVRKGKRKRMMDENMDGDTKRALRSLGYIR